MVTFIIEVSTVQVQRTRANPKAHVYICHQWVHRILQYPN